MSTTPRAMQVLSRVLAAFRVEIRLSALLAAATVADMARLVIEAQAARCEGPASADTLAARLAALPPGEARRLLDELEGPEAR